MKLLYSLVSSSTIFVDFIRVSIQPIMSSENNNNFSSSFPIVMAFLSLLSWPTVLFRTFTTILRSGENGPLTTSWFLRKRFYYFNIKYMLDVVWFLLFVCFHKCPLSAWGSSFSSFPCWIKFFIVKLLLNFVKPFVYSYWMEQWQKFLTKTYSNLFMSYINNRFQLLS